MTEYVLPFLTFVALILVWQLLVIGLGIPRVLLPTPVEIFSVSVERWPLLFSHTWVTLYETACGFLLAVALGIPLAIAMASSPVLQNTIYPLMVLAQSVPKVAVAPLFLIWVGYGVLSKVLVAFLVAFFPILVNTATGLSEVEPEMIDLIRSLDATKMQVFRMIRLPYAIPYIMAGAKVSVTLAVIGAVIGEFVGSDRGLGYVMLSASAAMKTNLNMAALVFLSIMGLGLFWLVVVLDKLLFPWNQPEER